MKKYMGYAAYGAMALGLVLLIAAVVCMCCAGSALGSLEDTYYYLGMNLHHGRFTASDASDVIAMLKDIGIADTVVSGGGIFAIYARVPLLVFGILLTAAGAFIALRGGFSISVNSAGSVCALCSKAGEVIRAAYRWAAAKLRGRRCPVCGERLIKGALFCGSCGAGAEASGKCPGCGTVNEPGAHYCNLCGRKID